MFQSGNKYIYIWKQKIKIITGSHEEALYITLAKNTAEQLQNNRELHNFNQSYFVLQVSGTQNEILVLEHE